MPKLILSMDGLVLKEIVLNKERITIGRKSFNDVQIDNLAISGEHASITTILDDAFLEDCNSTNGTYVNGQPIKKRILHHNDVIELGKYRLKFLVDPATESWSREAIDSGSLTSSGFDLRGKSSGTSSSTGGPSDERSVGNGLVRILSGPNAGKELPLTRSVTTLGKPGVQVAVITRRPEAYFLSHVEGVSFPIVNGATLDTQARPLAEHDIIEIAGVRMEFVLRAPSKGLAKD